MKSVKKLMASKLYLISSRSSVNSNYFEDENEIKLFWKKFNLYLKQYISVIDYHLGPNGYTLLIKVRSKSKIIKEYQKHQKRKNVKTYNDSIPVWRIISMRMQIFLSQVIKSINKKRGCKGSRSFSRFERYIFESKQEFLEKLESMKRDKIDLDQEVTEYRSNKQKFESFKQIKSFLYLWNSRKARKFEEGRNRVKKTCKSYIIKSLEPLLVLKLIEKTKSFHSGIILN